QPSAGDHLHTAVRAGLAAIPGVGGPAAELFNALIAPPLARRRDAWLNGLARGLRQLEEKVAGFGVEKLKDDPAFVSEVVEASQAAVRTHDEEKLDALRNAVLNIAASTAPEENLQPMLIALCDTLTPWHLRVLRFLDDPPSHLRDGVPGAGALATLLE